MEMWVDIQTKSYHCISSSKISSTTPVRSNLTAVHAVPVGSDGHGDNYCIKKSVLPSDKITTFCDTWITLEIEHGKFDLFL